MAVKKERELLFSLSKEKGDFVMETFRCGGNGGQNVNKRDTGVRIKHPASGSVGESREERSQLQNKRIAFTRCCETELFKAWHKVKTAGILVGIADMEAHVQKKVDDWMKDENLLIEYYDPDNPEVEKHEKHERKKKK